MKAPYQLTPIHDWHKRNGAQTFIVEGWVRVEKYGDAQTEINAATANAGICDITPLAKIDIQGARSGEVLQELGGVSMPAIGESVSYTLQGHSRPVCIVRLTSDRYWILADAKLRGQLTTHLANVARERGCVHVSDVTSAYAAILFVGPSAKAVLKKLGSAPIDQMLTGNCVQTTTARVWSLLVHCEVRQGSTWMLLVSRDYGEYVWESVLEAGQEFGLRAIGLTAAKATTGWGETDVAAL